MSYVGKNKIKLYIIPSSDQRISLFFYVFSLRYRLLILYGNILKFLKCDGSTGMLFKVENILELSQNGI